MCILVFISSHLIYGAFIIHHSLFIVHCIHPSYGIQCHGCPGRDRRGPPLAVLSGRVFGNDRCGYPGTCDSAVADRFVIVIQSTSYLIIRSIYTSRLNLFSLGL